MVQINNISKTYKGYVEAVKDVSFHVGKGELFGLIGPDGAGKTSIFRMLATLLLPDSGSATIKGYDMVDDYQKIRNIIGYMPGRFSLYQDLSVEENLTFFATVYKTSIAENYDLIKDIYVQLEPFKDRKAGQLSGGMKQKLALCCALIHKPEILFLDEPTTGVDVVSRKEFWNILKDLAAQGITILVSTPYMDEAGLCDRIALIQDGEILSVNTPEAVINDYGQPLYAVKGENMGVLLRDLEALEEVETCNAFGDYHHITLHEDVENWKEILSDKLKDKHENLEMKTITPTVEDCFIKLMK